MRVALALILRNGTAEHLDNIFHAQRTLRELSFDLRATIERRKVEIAETARVHAAYNCAVVALQGGQVGLFDG